MHGSLKELLEREPFQPFRIITAGGTKYEVKSPGLVIVAKSQIFYCFPRSDRLAYIPIRQITSLEALQPA